jgi:hypothetical protein
LSFPAKALVRVLLVAVLALLTFLPVQILLGTGIDRLVKGTDNTSYYAFTRSVGLDGDIDLKNDHDLLEVRRSLYSREVEETGYDAFAFAVGFPFLQLPFFWLGLGLSALLGQATDGLAPATTACYFYGVTFWGWLGVSFFYDFVRLFFSRAASLSAALASVMLTNLGWYFFNALSHGPSFMSVSLFLYLVFLLRRRDKLRHWVVLGLAGGFMFLVRWQDILFWLILVADVLAHEVRSLFSLRGKELGEAVLRLVTRGMVGIVCLAVMMLPQLLVWKTIYDTWLTVPQGDYYLSRNFDLFLVLFSSAHGWISWHPVVGLGLFGSLVCIRRRPWVWALLLLSVALQVTMCSRILDIEGGYAFGMRRLVSSLPIAMWGLAALVDVCLRRAWLISLLGVTGIVLLWFNVTFAVQYKYYLVPPFGRLNMYEYLWGKFQLDREFKWLQAVNNGRASLGQGRFEEGVKWLNMAIDISPHHVRPYKILEQAYRRRGNLTMAERYRSQYDKIDAKRIP